MRTHRGRTDLEEKSSDDNQAKHICKFTYKYASEDCFSVARRCRARAMHQRFFIFAPKKARARKRRCSLHAQARLRFARCALLRLCRNACRAIFAFALMSKLLYANCLIIEKTNSNGENRRFSTSIPFKYLYNKSGGTISMSPLVFYSVIPKCDSPFLIFYRYARPMATSSIGINAVSHSAQRSRRRGKSENPPPDIFMIASART